MSSAGTGIVLLISLALVTLLGQWLRRRLPEHHLSAESRDAIKLAIGLIATMSALFLGLLVVAAKSTHDARRTEFIQMAAKVHLLDHVLAEYGSDAAEARAGLREAVVEYVRYIRSGEAGEWDQLESVWQADSRFRAGVLGLSPRDEAQRDLKARTASLTTDVEQLRMLLLAQREPSLPKPFLILVTCWLGFVFLSFSLLAPPNATTGLVLLAAAMSVVGAVFLSMEFDRPQGGMISISTKPLLDALHLPGT